MCVTHGGSIRRVKAAAARRLAEAEANAKAAKALAVHGGPASDLEPVTALLAVAQQILAFSQVVNEMLAEVRATDWRRDHRAGEQIHALVPLFERSLDRAARVLVDINRLGLEEKRIRITQGQVILLNEALKAILRRLELDERQQLVAGQIVSEELRAISDSEAAKAAMAERAGRAHNFGDRRR